MARLRGGGLRQKTIWSFDYVGKNFICVHFRIIVNFDRFGVDWDPRKSQAGKSRGRDRMVCRERYSEGKEPRERSPRLLGQRGGGGAGESGLFKTTLEGFSLWQPKKGCRKHLQGQPTTPVVSHGGVRVRVGVRVGWGLSGDWRWGAVGLTGPGDGE